jgi:Kdo-III transferase WaaZ
MLLKRMTKGLRRRVWETWCPRRPWHMRHYDQRFVLQSASDVTHIYWSGRHVADSLSATRLQRSSDILAIVASGPTLLHTPAAAWAKRDVACVNGSILWARERGVRPLLYVVSDPGFVRRRPDLIRLAAELSGAVCLSTRCLFEALTSDPSLFVGRKLVVVANANQPYGRSVYTRQEIAANPLIKVDPLRMYRDRYIGISRDPDFGIFGGGTVVIGAAQVALSMGYRDLQFLGLDMTNGEIPARFYREAKPAPSFIDRNFERLILPSFELLRAVCDEIGARMSNWSFNSAVPRHLVPQAGTASELALSA